MKDFVYDSENHLGYFKGKLIPSITQLVSILFPLGNVNDEVLEKSCVRGTTVHEDIDNACLGLVSSCGTKEGKNWQRLVKALDLEVVNSEFEVYLKDDDDNIIAYGHVDQMFKANSCVYYDKKGNLHIEKNPVFEGGETILWQEGATILNDNKTVSQFDNDKVELQLNLYSIGEDEDFMGKLVVTDLIGIWVRDDKAQVRLLNKWKEEKARTMLFDLVRIWKEREERNGNN